MSKEKRKQFTFAETKQTEGLVEKIDLCAKIAKRKRNDWLNIQLSKLVEVFLKNNK